MKLAVTPFSVHSIPKVLDIGADIVLVGNHTYANRLVHSFSELELKDITEMVHKQGKEVYIILNQIVHDKDLDGVDGFLDLCQNLAVDGILFGDVAVYQLAKEKGLIDKLIYHPETLNTNYYDPLFWHKKGIKGVVVAKEITIDEIEHIATTSPIETMYIGHGHLNMFHSRRPLIENFFQYREEEYKQYIDNRNLRLVEEIRNESYPVFQDEHGTHIFRDKPMHSFDEIDRLKDCLDVLIIDGIFMDTDYVIEAVENYKTVLQNNGKKHLKAIKKQYKDTHDSGFLHKKTIYDTL